MPDFVLVLIAPPGHAAELSALASIATQLPRAQQVSGRWGDPDWLAPGEALQIPFTAADAHAAGIVRAAVAQAGEALTIDVCAVPAADRRKALLVADMDSTIIRQECIDEMADMAGIKPAIAAITERAMRGELAFEAALKERLGLLAGLTERQLLDVLAQRITLMPGARTLVATMRANGAYTALVSGGFTFFTTRVAEAVGFQENRANELEMTDGRLTGRVVEPILGREAKLAALRGIAAERGIPPSLTLAVGDGANDLAMIEASGLGVAYRAKPVVAAAAAAAIAHGDLTALLYLQGYRRAEFAAT